jgi:serine protease Do
MPPGKTIRLEGKAWRPMSGMRRRSSPIAFLSVVLISLLPAMVLGQAVLPETQKVFDKYSDRVVKIQVLEKNSGAKTVIGSGFFVTPSGGIITNYHVVSKLVLHPDRYRSELVEKGGAIRSFSVIGVDVINDLALVKTDVNDAPFLKIAAGEPRQGERLYSMGFPLDIGLSIVEGTYNGLLKHALYRKIHFTGSINRGMSGGPTISASGEVVGVNVSTRGQQVGFLVPAEPVARVMNSAGPARKDTEGFLEEIRSQILVHQDLYFTDDLMKSGQTVHMGDFRLPGQLAPFFKCWGDSKPQENLPYHIADQRCSTDDAIYISGEHSSGVMTFTHHYLTNDGMNRFRFSNLHSQFFQAWNHFMPGDEEEVTRFQCKAGTVKRGRITFKTVFCVRGYKKLKGLYDVVFKAAVLGSDEFGLETELNVSGVSFEKAVGLAKGYLEMVTWGK